jgi:hypothetical protein
VTEPKVTVLLTTYNHERFVEQALRSVLDQVTTFPFEVVVIEDCSTDGTRELVRAYAARHPEVVRLALTRTNENSNRMFAEQWATRGSEYVAMLDGDDYWTSPDKLERQVALLSSRPECSFCFHDALMVSESPRGPQPRRFVGDDARSDLAEVIWTRCVIPGSSPVLRRGLLPRLPVWWVSGTDAGNSPHGDWALFLLFAELGAIAYIDEVLGVYRVHAGGLWSSRRPEEQRQDIIDVLESLLEVFPEREPVIQSALDGHRALQEKERRRRLRSDALARVKMGGKQLAAIESALAGYVPAESKVVWVDPAMQPTRLSRPLLSLPAAAATSWQLFARGGTGSRAAPWIAPGHAYEFRLLSNGDQKRVLALATVVADTAGSTTVHDEAGAVSELPTAGAFLVAKPNPAPVIDTHARTEVSWSTGDGSSGDVVVASHPLEQGLPEDGAAAIAELERLRASGGDFLLMPPHANWWLDLYPELDQRLTKHYRLLVNDSQVGRLYDLRR